MTFRSYVELKNARGPQQLEAMEGILQDGVCPFCVESLAKYHKKPILEEGQYWLVTENQWPYENTLFHLLMIAREHVTTLADFGEKAGPAFAELGILATKYLGIFNTDTAALGMRIGDPAQTGGTVDHLHAHLMKLDPEAPQGTKLRMKLGEKN